LHLEIDLDGGDIVKLSLPAYADDSEPPRKDFVLFDQSPKRYYIAQSGLTGEQGPDLRGVGRAKYETAQPAYKMMEGEDRLVVDLVTKTKEGILVTKRYVFLRGDYVINLEYLITNESTQDYTGSFYARLKRKPDPNASSGIFGMGIQTYTGAALYTKDTPYKKFSFKDIADKPFTGEIEGGWAAMVEHYFVSAFIPEPGVSYTYQTQPLGDGAYAVGFIAPPLKVAAGEQGNIEAKLYAGPEITETLESLGKGLDLSVDYGVLWPICQPIFWVLKMINSVVQNWGWSIVIITILIKLLFYKLSATSYRSMGNMRKLQPKMEALKARYGEDKQGYSKAVMELYKKEKVNPLGGCLPILIQIPVFIALYYVLLGSVELRQAPFILWITDLSAKDPYYVLPILMGLSMYVQQKLNPAPADPMQAKVFMFMPVIFTVLFLNFPSGLVLYWLVNNILSIIQQWFITRKIVSSHAHGAS
jgi:YidC/Oxa1 family membrane protein insertase